METKAPSLIPVDGSFEPNSTERPFENLVALQVRWRGNRLERKFPLDLVLEVEEHQLVIPTKMGLFKRISQQISGQEETTGESIRLRIRLRHCHIRYSSAEIDILSNTKYEYRISSGKVQLRTSQSWDNTTNTQAGLALGLNTALSPAGSDASAKGHLGASYNETTKRVHQTKAEFEPEIFEIRAVPDGWRVGDRQHGDLTKPFGLLDGRYFHKHVEGYPYTCEAAFREDYRRGTIIFRVTVRDGLDVKRLDGSGNKRTDEELARAAMRDRIAELRVSRAFGGLRSEAEMTLAAVSCSVICAPDEPVFRVETPPLEPSICEPDVPQRLPRSRRKIVRP